MTEMEWILINIKCRYLESTIENMQHKLEDLQAENNHLQNKLDNLQVDNNRLQKQLDNHVAIETAVDKAMNEYNNRIRTTIVKALEDTENVMKISTSCRIHKLGIYVEEKMEDKMTYYRNKHASDIKYYLNRFLWPLYGLTIATTVLLILLSAPAIARFFDR